MHVKILKKWTYKGGSSIFQMEVTSLRNMPTYGSCKNNLLANAVTSFSVYGCALSGQMKESSELA